MSDAAAHEEVRLDALGGSQLVTLQALTARLARTTSSAEVASSVLDEGVERLGASSGSLCLVVDGELEIAAAVGYPESVRSTYRRFPIDSTSPAGVCASTRQAVYCRSIAELYEQFPSFRDRPLVGDPSFAVLPLEARDTTLLGTMVIGFAVPQLFESGEREFLEALAREAAVALDAAQVSEALVEARSAAEAAREQLGFLAEASSRLAGSLDLAATQQTIAELAVPRVADRCLLYLVSSSLELERNVLAPSLNDDEAELLAWTSPSLDDAHGTGAVTRSGQAIYVPEMLDQTLADAADSPAHLELLRRVGIGGTFIAPLQARGERIGALAFVNRRDRPFTRDDRALAAELAARAAVAIDNARLFSRTLGIAETLQHALLPDSLPVVDGLAFGASYLPGTQGLDVGGDWYDVIVLDEKHIVFTVGDVSGRGLQAATLMASIRHATRAYALEGNEPHMMLVHLGQLLDLARDGHFATMLCGLVNITRHEATIANAGHLDPLLLDADGARFVPAAVAPPIGVQRSYPYRSVVVSLPARSTLIAYTDGLVERRREHLDVGLSRLRAAGEANRHLPLDALLEAITSELIGAGAEDDTAVLALRFEQ